MALSLGAPVFADEARLSELMAELADPAAENWERTEKRIMDIWSKSGSRSADLLLQRGRDALQAKDTKAALEHFTALTDHAPDFAEGWNARATVFFEMKEYGLSISDISRALSLNPHHFEAMTGLALIMEQLDEPDEALRIFREVARLNPHREVVQDAIERLEPAIDGRDI